MHVHMQVRPEDMRYLLVQGVLQAGGLVLDPAAAADEQALAAVRV